MRAGYFREVFGSDGDDGDGRIEIDHENKYEALHEAFRRLLLATHWDDRLPDSMSNFQYRGLIASVSGADDAGAWSFDKGQLRDIADHLGARYGPRATTRELRGAIADSAGFDYDSPDSYIRDFTKDELKTLAAAVIREEHFEEAL